MKLLAVNAGRSGAVRYTDGPGGLTGVDKRPNPNPGPGPKGTGGSGLSGDTVCDLRHHGGTDQAVRAAGPAPRPVPWPVPRSVPRSVPRPGETDGG